MPTATRPHAGDPALRPFLEALSESGASAALEALLAGEVDAVLRETVRRSLREFGADSSDADDIAGDVRLRLVRRLWSLRAGAGEPIDNFIGYTVGAAENACYGFLRQRYPARTRFRNRVRYAAAHHPGTMLERDERGLWQCRTRRAARVAPRGGTTRAFLDAPAAALARVNIDVALPLPALVDELLASFDEPIDLDSLVNGLAAALGIVDSRGVASRTDGPDLLAQAHDPAPAIHDVLEHREALRRVWREVVQLPARQRAALLLNLRDGEGGGVLQSLPATGVVRFADVATALGMAAAELEALWDGLPMDDLAIAARLGVNRQQVINLRKAARARLARRLGEGAQW